MKRTFTYFWGLVALAAVILSSCKSHERCPAYGKANVPQEIPS